MPKGKKTKLNPRHVVPIVDPVFDTREAAKRIGTTAETLAFWRVTKREPFLPFFRIGRSIRYRLSDIEEFLQQRRVAS
jgi:predicted DNA-binding transcriptional regulator AlpA